MSSRSTRSGGRPKRLTIDRLLDEAQAMGVDALEMAPLAQRLGVATGTLYGYVHNREHLIFLLASRQLKLATVEDTGQPWQDVLRQHSALTYDRLRRWPQLIVNLVGGNAAPDFGAATLRDVTTMLSARGISRNWARRLYLEANQVVLGAVVAAQFIDSIMTRATGDASIDTSARLPEEFGRFEPGLERLIDWYDTLERGSSLSPPRS